MAKKKVDQAAPADANTLVVSGAQPDKVKKQGRSCGGWLIWLMKTVVGSFLFLCVVMYFASKSSNDTPKITPQATQASIAPMTDANSSPLSTAKPEIRSGSATLDNGKVKWDIARIESRDWAGDWHPVEGKTYLTVFGTLSNPYAKAGRVGYYQVWARIDGNDYRPKTDVMAKMIDDLNQMDYIGPSSLEVLPGENHEVFVTFEVPKAWKQIGLKLDDAFIWLVPDSEMTVAQVSPSETPTATLTLTPTITVSPTITNTPMAVPVMPSTTITDTPIAAVPQVAVVATATVVPTAGFDEADYVSKISNTLFVGAGGRDVASVRVADGRPNGGERAIIVAYNTTETTSDGRVDEVLDLYEAIGVGIYTDHLDVDSVSLIMGVNNQAAIIMVAPAAAVVARGTGKMIKDDFVKTIQITDMTGGSATTAPNASSRVLPVDPKTYYAEAMVNVRSCEKKDCSLVTTLAKGDSVIVDGMIDGDAVNAGNKIWYRVKVNGLIGYVYSDLVNTVRPATSSASGGGSTTSSTNQSVVPVQSIPNTQGFQCPSNCKEAVAMGVSAQQAAACGLDRDGDGEACYGN